MKSINNDAENFLQASRMKPAILHLTLHYTDYFGGARGTTEIEIFTANRLRALNFEVVGFFSDTDIGFQSFWPRRKTVYAILNLLEKRNLVGSTLIVEDLERFKEMLYPFVKKQLLAKCKMVALNDI